MANTYTLINSTSLSSSAASVTFSAIPATYDDLVLQISARSDNASNTTNIYVTLSGDTGSNYSETLVRGDGSNAYSDGFSNITPFFRSLQAVGDSATSNTFSSVELYFPKYTTSANKPASFFSITENNATAASLRAGAGLWRNSSAITSILIEQIGSNFKSGSTFWLYGIKNS